MSPSALRTTVLKGASYERVSTIFQAHDKDGIYKIDSSPAIQRARCLDYVKSRSNKEVQYNIIEHIEDVGFSGKDTNRPGYKKLIRFITTKQIDFVIITELSRLSRSLSDFLQFTDLCHRNNVSIIVIGLSLDTTTPQGKFFGSLLMGMSQFEREITALRVSQNALARLIKDGKINGASEVLGLDIIVNNSHKGHFKINKKESLILEKILNEYLRTGSKKLTYEFIVRENIQWKPGKPFTRQRFELMFKMVFHRYRGQYPSNLKNFELYLTGKSVEENYQLVVLPHGPVVPLSLLDKVQEKLKSIKHKVRGNIKVYIYPLSGLLFSASGVRYQGQPGKDLAYRYYFDPTNRCRIRCDEIEDRIFDCLKGYLTDNLKLDELLKRSTVRRNNRINEINIEMKEVDQKISGCHLQKQKLIENVNTLIESFGNTLNQEILKGLNEELVNTQNDIDAHRNKKVDLISEYEQLQKQLSPKELENASKEIFKNLKGLTNEVKRTFMFKIFKRIVINEDRLELHFYDDLFGIKNPEGVKPQPNLGKAPSSGYGINGGSNKT